MDDLGTNGLWNQWVRSCRNTRWRLQWRFDGGGDALGVSPRRPVPPKRYQVTQGTEVSGGHRAAAIGSGVAAARRLRVTPSVGGVRTDAREAIRPFALARLSALSSAAGEPAASTTTSAVRHCTSLATTSRAPMPSFSALATRSADTSQTLVRSTPLTGGKMRNESTVSEE